MDDLHELEQKLEKMTTEEKEIWLFKMVSELYEYSPERIEEINQALN